MVIRAQIPYAGGMTEPDHLQNAANRGEMAAARKLALRAGIPLERALAAVLEARAGAAGLPALLAERQALRRAEAARLAHKAAVRAAAATARTALHAGAPTAWRAWFDGSARPNPGRCGIGGLLRGPSGELVELSRDAGHGNSSEAEYLALIAVLEAALAHAAWPLTVYGDSQVVIGDVNGPPGQGAAALQPYRARVHALLARLPDVTLRWVPRHRNLEADALSQRASAAGCLDA